MNISAPVSGMNAAQLRMDNVANNVANVNTQGFEARRLQQAETAPAQATAAPQQDTFESTTTGTTATTAAQPSQTVGTGTEAYAAGAEPPDLARDMADMATQRNTYSANAQATRVQNSVIGQTINLLG
ncbi:MAG: flagellar basal body protein [Chitinispirillia bacterium]|nr:flagellar basal body protein [Chitinispirillia bacterium]MCL2269195.1 flagellar basal body protein [Chitinispirillia bacterium]